MGKHDPITAPPYTPDTLAARWGVTPNAIRKKCAEGTLEHFRFGKLYRIPARVVEDIETCQTSASDACAADTSPTPAPEAVSAAVAANTRARKPRRGV